MTRSSRFVRFSSKITKRRWGSWLARVIYTPLDKALYKLTGGRRGLSPKQAMLVLTTTGRKSGRPRSVPVIYLRDGDTFWVMASNYAQAHHPAWSWNLIAHPQAEITIGNEVRRVTARLAGDEEKREMWPRLLELYPAWEQYAQWTNRDFRLFALEPGP